MAFFLKLSSQATNIPKFIGGSMNKQNNHFTDLKKATKLSPPAFFINTQTAEFLL